MADANQRRTHARAKNVIPDPKVQRVILETLRSIPTHLAALRAFEPNNPSEQRKPPTTLYVNILGEFEEYGFVISRETIRGALQNQCKYREDTLQKLNNWAGPSSV
ncbi:hypothetical protein [Paraburkholderia fungorum]|uniref:hypothetical protein n=1 Tax=Paraburkholderia fungorum TaxID=134537 RepID=UPI00115FF467|nr:hypothetical protein [Paraburkholderia fungorum]